MPVLNATEPERNDGNTENQNIILLVVKPGVRYVVEPEKEPGIMAEKNINQTFSSGRNGLIHHDFAQ